MRRLGPNQATQLLALVAGFLLIGNLLVVRSVREVTVVVDGEPTTLRTLSGTVGEAVASLGIDVRPRDALSPSADQPLVSGDTIEYVRARPVSITVDGAPRSIVAPVLTVREAIEYLDLPHAIQELWVNQSLTRPTAGGTVVRVRLPRDVTIAADGETTAVTTTMRTVSAALKEAGIEVGPDDIVEPGLNALVEDGAMILVARVEQETITVDQAIPYETIERETDELYRGDSRVAQSGVQGVRRVTYRITRVDGAETERDELSREVVTEPIPRIVEYGTRDYPPGVNGIDEGLASYYGCGDGFDGQRTASGEIFDDQAMTAAHRTLPFGTIVTVESHETGRTVKVRINDRGPAAWTGKLIDLSCAAMIELAGVTDGSHPVTITW
ncbi:MAG TPA: septal ring lytic transglycosylase RlpA family protein [Nitriliruptorales bacterium]